MIVRRVLSLSVGIETPSLDLSAELSCLTASWPSPSPETPLGVVYRIDEAEGRYRVSWDGTSEQGLGREEVFCTLQADLSARLAESREFGLLHAAALVRRGKALLLAGESGVGKTTLSAVMLKRGFGYLSDEFAPLSSDLTVRSCPFPLRLRESALRLLPSLAPELTLWPTPFGATGDEVFYGLPAPWLSSPEAPVPVGLIVFPRAGASGGGELRKLTPGLAALRLMALTLNGEFLGDRGFLMVADLVERIPGYDLRLGGVEEAARLVEDLWERIVHA